MANRGTSSASNPTHSDKDPSDRDVDRIADYTRGKGDCPSSAVQREGFNASIAVEVKRRRLTVFAPGSPMSSSVKTLGRKVRDARHSCLPDGGVGIRALSGWICLLGTSIDVERGFCRTCHA